MHFVSCQYRRFYKFDCYIELKLCFRQTSYWIQLQNSIQLGFLIHLKFVEMFLVWELDGWHRLKLIILIHKIGNLLCILAKSQSNVHGVFLSVADWKIFFQAWPILIIFTCYWRIYCRMLWILWNLTLFLQHYSVIFCSPDYREWLIQKPFEYMVQLQIPSYFQMKVFLRIILVVTWLCWK